MKPVQQVFALVLENTKEFKKKYRTPRRWNNKINAIKKKYSDKVTCDKRIETMRNKEVKALLFDDFLTKIQNKRNGHSSIVDYFGTMGY